MVADEENVQLASLLYSGLVRLDASYHVVPSAATWKLSKDRRTYTFFLRHDLKFSNGDPVTARDFQFAITRALTPALKSPSAPTYLLDIKGASDVLSGAAKSVSGIKVLGRWTIQITTRWAVRYFLMELTYPTSYALDSKRLSKLEPVDNFSWYAHPIGSGPYRLKSWTPNSKMVLVPNAHFASPRPSISQVTISLAPLPAVDLYQYVTRNLDVVGLPSSNRSLVHLAGVRETNSLAIDALYMNLRQKPFGNVKVRRALAMALSRRALVSKAMGASVTPFHGFVPFGEAGYDGQLKALPYSVSQARMALKAAGYSGGKGFPATTLYYTEDPANPGLGKLAQSIAKTWHRNLNINVDTVALTLNTLLAKVQSNSLPLYLAGWIADYPDPHDWLSAQWSTGALNNNVQYHNKRFDTLVQTADVTWDDSQRMRLYHAAQQILVSDAACIPLYIPHRLAYVRPEVMNIAVTGYGIMPRGGSWADVQIRVPPPKLRREM